jgi:putative NADPH-quinone reductase
LEWRYVKDNSVSEGDDSGWVDRVVWSGGTKPPSGGPLSQALDTSLSFTTDGDADWFSQTAMSYFDGDAAKSGITWDGQVSWMQTTIHGSGTFSFYWKVSSEAGYDYLEFYIDGVLQDSAISASDLHTLEWRYVKDNSVSEGDDSGWVDRVVWSGGTQPPSSGPLSQALDTSLSLTTDGDAEWFSQTDMSYFDGDAAKSGAILDNQESLIQALVSGTGTFSFYWKVSSEASCDFLEFYIDGVLQDRISGTQDWHQMVYTITGSGLHTLNWRYVKDESISSGSDSGWVDRVVWSGGTKPPSDGLLSQALDTSLSLTTGGDSAWFSQTAISYFDGDAAQSGAILDNQESLMQTLVSGSGTFSFYWKVSSETSCDFLEFYIDGVLQDRISGSEDWHQMTYAISASGSHSLEWRYVKDFSISERDDSGWVDRVVWSGGTKPPSGGPLSQALDTSLSLTTGGDSAWFSQTVMSYFDGDSAQSGVILDNQESWMQTTIHGSGTFSFYWKVSSEAGYDYLEFYIDGVLQDRISGSANWQQMMYTIIGSGLHTLEWRYVKDNSVSERDDCGWVDQLEGLWGDWGDWGDWWIEIR